MAGLLTFTALTLCNERPGSFPARVAGGKADLQAYHDMLVTIRQRVRIRPERPFPGAGSGRGPAKEFDERWGKVLYGRAFVQRVYIELAKS